MRPNLHVVKFPPLLWKALRPHARRHKVSVNRLCAMTTWWWLLKGAQFMPIPEFDDRASIYLGVGDAPPPDRPPDSFPKNGERVNARPPGVIRPSDGYHPTPPAPARERADAEAMDRYLPTGRLLGEGAVVVNWPDD